MNIIKKSSRGYDVLPLESQLLENRMIFITQEINSASCDQIIKELLYLDMLDHTTPINILINSPGGEVDSGMAVLDIMKQIASPIRTVCIGQCASMAAILFEGASGGMRCLLDNSKLMIHGPSYGNRNIGGLKVEELREEMEKLNKLNETFANLLTQITNIEEDKVYEILSKDSYFNAKEAMELNLADCILDSQTFRKDLMGYE